jgi:membrane-associated protease RseP (regulator of RpoE activity)
MLFYVLNICALMLCVAVHEYGHYITARRAGLIPPQFGVGLGPKIAWFNWKGTEFSLRPIPLGGFVKIETGELESLSHRTQIGILAAGPLMNLLLCLVLVAVYTIIGGRLPAYFADMTSFEFFFYALGLTIVLFIASIPLTVYALAVTFLHPIAGIDNMAGPIGIVTGTMIPSSMLAGYTPFEQFLFLSWVLSLGLGTFNLVPLSFLDGGRIFHILMSRWPKFQLAWQGGTTALLAMLVIYLVIGDVWKLIR